MPKPSRSQKNPKIRIEGEKDEVANKAKQAKRALKKDLKEESDD